MELDFEGSGSSFVRWLVAVDGDFVDENIFSEANGH